MYHEPIFLTPVFQERIWGGQKLNTEYGYELSYERTGEAWVISAHPHGPNIIQNGSLAGKTLAYLWENHGDLFNKDRSKNEEYPLLVKLLDANDDLSVQVHPDDIFARHVEEVPYGKTECWYILSAEADSEIILGHNAQTKEEMEQMMDNGKWGELLQRKKVRAGDFFYVASGTIHAIGKGMMILEIQQSSDITYRVYDYDRMDDEGNKRQLQLEQAKKVTTVPHVLPHNERTKEKTQGLVSEKLVEAQYFSVYHWTLKGMVSRQLTEDFLQVNVLKGNAEIKVGGQSFALKKGSHFILPHGVQTYELSGDAEFVVSHV
ncbi:mannose-6-phosphate isomerase, class I [Oceanobacillus neutriphilus]|uniref:Mannose-6-phosphate isomerase n=1 Tax=Oceanobacillus neutriphilus TaxID=531815 RepID=A0ABQ2NV06_9BACI|nr:mannose-6-phosphate isomerase, class I [Oceanobacillus neutriphilus]GGP11194.1 mannose-6-phosphate isomerase, class I [Oceanobacillus neutriphilus]